MDISLHSSSFKGWQWQYTFADFPPKLPNYHQLFMSSQNNFLVQSILVPCLQIKMILHELMQHIKNDNLLKKKIAHAINVQCTFYIYMTLKVKQTILAWIKVFSIFKYSLFSWSQKPMRSSCERYSKASKLFLSPKLICKIKIKVHLRCLEIVVAFINERNFKILLRTNTILLRRNDILLRTNEILLRTNNLFLWTMVLLRKKLTVEERLGLYTELKKTIIF